MPISLSTLSLVASPVTLQQGLKILERDDYRCQYCGLDGRASFENALVMSVDFVVPRLARERRIRRIWSPAARPCNTIKGTRAYGNLEEAKEHVLAHREELRKAWESKTARRSPVRRRRAAAIRSAAWCPWSTCRSLCLLVRLSSHPLSLALAQEFFALRLR